MDYIPPKVSDKDVEDFKVLYEKKNNACLLPTRARQAAQDVLSYIYYTRVALPQSIKYEKALRRSARHKKKLRSETMRKRTLLIEG